MGANPWDSGSEGRLSVIAAEYLVKKGEDICDSPCSFLLLHLLYCIV